MVEHKPWSVLGIFVAQKRKRWICWNGQGHTLVTSTHISLASPPHKVHCGFRWLQGKWPQPFILPESYGRVFVAWGQPWKQAQEGLTLVVKCFSLEVTHLSCAYSPLADGPWPTWWWGEGRGIREGPRVRCGWHQKYLPEAHSEMTFPGSCGYAGTLTGWTPGLPNSKTHTPPTTTYSATKCSLANKTPLRTQVAVE